MTMRFPVALWQDFAGTFTASVLDGATLAAYDRTAAGALAQLERYIAWAMRKGATNIGESDFIDLELAVLTNGAVTTDNVASNDVPFLADFPFFAPEHPPSDRNGD